jgi:hypothetical protein
MISAKITKLLNEIEELAEEGKVDESKKLTQIVDQLNSEKESILANREMDFAKALAATSQQQEKRMRVCEICGGFLVIGDQEKRIISHMEGKQHQGYLIIRKTLSELRKFYPIEEERRDRYPRSPPRRRSYEKEKRDRPPITRETEKDHRDERREYHDRDNRKRDREYYDRRRDRDSPERSRKRYRDDY